MLKHVYFQHPNTLFYDEQTDIANSVYCGLYDVTREQILFGHVAKPGEAIQIDQGKKAANPQTLTPRQARLALNHFGMRDAVEQAVSGNINFKDEWEFANEVDRNWSTLVTLSEQIGITSEQLDELFRYGSRL
jgi:hypothetical protein